MKTELKAKFLQHILDKKKGDEGFTLIELLVVIIIIGILSAIALPSFLNQANKAKQSEAKTYVGSMNRGQQAYYTENSSFGATVDELGIGIKTSTSNYSYGTAVTVGTGTTLSYATTYSDLQTNIKGLRNYGGRVYLQSVGTNSELTSISFLCEAKDVEVSGSGLTGTSSCTTSAKLLK